MTLLDGVVLVLVAIGGIVGYRIGFLIRALSWLGLSIGLMIGLRLTPRIARSLLESTPGIRLLAVSALLIGLALIGHTVGLVASRSLRSRLELSNDASTLDRWTGGLVGALGVVALLWLLVPALRSTPGWPARAARSSRMVAFVHEYAPPPPRAARVLGRLIGAAPYPEIRGDPTGIGEPPSVDAGPAVTARSARSVVLVVGDACGQRISGTGFAVGSSTVVTNAHVVAGEDRTEIVTTDGRRLLARVVLFNPTHDIAVLEVPDAELTPLALGPTKVGTIATVLGHPNGGRLRATPARVARRLDTPRTDIYRNGTIKTSVIGLAAHLIVGDSGAPVVGPDGRVQGMVFAVDPAVDTTAFALSTAELAPFVRLGQRSLRPVSTGTCLIG